MNQAEWFSINRPLQGRAIAGLDGFVVEHRIVC